MAMARQQGAGMARSREFWHLFVALSSDASAGAALAGAVEHALDEPVGVGHKPACHTGAGCPELLLRRAASNGLGQEPFQNNGCLACGQIGRLNPGLNCHLSQHAESGTIYTNMAP